MNIFNYLNRYKYIIISVLLVFILTLYLVFNNLKKEELVVEEIILEKNIEEEKEKNIEEEKEKIIEVKKIKIDIKGAVLNPGVYELEENSRVKDAIDISGGLTKKADTSIINLSKTLKDEMVIIIYTKDEIDEMKKGDTVIKYIEKECVCPKIENDACIEEKITNEKTENTTEENNVKKENKVYLNSATIEELMTLSGIGESKAKLIIEYRNANGGFKSIEEITNVKGIGKSTYEKIKDILAL